MRQNIILFIASGIFAVAHPTTSTARAISTPTPAPLAYSAEGAVDLPTIASITPAVGISGFSIRVLITGTNFVAGSTTVQVSEGGVTPSMAHVLSSTELIVTFDIDRDVTVGERDVTVTTLYGVSNSGTFTIYFQRPGL